MHRAKVLLIDDDDAILAALSEYLSQQGFNVVPTSNLKSGYQVLENQAPDVAIVDYELPDGDALQFLTAVKNLGSATQTIVLTGFASIDLAVRAIKEGAQQFATKPVQFAVLGSYVNACLEQQQNRRKQLARKLRSSRYEKDPFQGTSPLIRQLAQEARRIVNAERPILLHGETGTGKGVLAEWLHKNGPRAEEAFVDINCAGLSKDLLESELFGYEKGAFTGAMASKLGLMEVAHRGILFLDEIGEMDVMVQPKLLKVLENNRFRRLGDVRERTVDVQLIVATNRNLMQNVNEMKFREDLYFRISTFQLPIPPLRERREDIPVLANTLLKNLADDLAREKQELSSASEAVLKAYSWPGNIRELRNLLERVALTCDSQVIEPQHLNLPHRGPSPVEQFGRANMTLAQVERHHIETVLKEESGKVAPAAVRLDISRSTLYQKIKEYGISLD